MMYSGPVWGIVVNIDVLPAFLCLKQGTEMAAVGILRIRVAVCKAVIVEKLLRFPKRGNGSKQLLYGF